MAASAPLRQRRTQSSSPAVRSRISSTMARRAAGISGGIGTGSSQRRGECRTPGVRSQPLLPVVRHVLCLISKLPPPLDLRWVVDPAWLPGQVSLLLQQGSGSRRGQLQYLRRARPDPVPRAGPANARLRTSRTTSSRRPAASVMRFSAVPRGRPAAACKTTPMSKMLLTTQSSNSSAWSARSVAGDKPAASGSACTSRPSVPAATAASSQG